MVAELLATNYVQGTGLDENVFDLLIKKFASS
jgi:hypothetical protein